MMGRRDASGWYFHVPLRGLDVVAVDGQHLSQSLAGSLPSLEAHETEREIVAGCQEQRGGGRAVASACKTETIVTAAVRKRHCNNCSVYNAPVLPKPTFLTKSMLMRYLLAARNGCNAPYATLPSSLACADACSRCVSLSLLYLAHLLRVQM
jgi:hypothetical protein